tara:strand:- start:47 stop:526 length:480 start_codon:yes stop_codon:yes gene_type:complete
MLNSWQFYAVVGAIIIAITRIGRKYAYDNVEMDARVGWFYVMIGVLIASLFGLIYYIVSCPKLCKTLLMPNSINKYKDNYGNNMIYLKILAGIMMVIVFFFYNKSIYLADNPGFTAGLFAGIATMLTYLGYSLSFNKKLNVKEIMGLVLIIIGIFMVSV